MVGDGLPQSVAARGLSIPNNTVSTWYAKGCDDLDSGDETPLASFARDLNAARGSSIYKHVQNVNRCAEGGQLIREKSGTDRAGNEYSERAWTAPDWRASAHLLAVMDPENFAAKSRIEHSGTFRHENLNVNLSGNLDDAQLVALARLAAAMGQHPTPEAGQAPDAGHAQDSRDSRQ
jgi:hypothetical protein